MAHLEDVGVADRQARFRRLGVGVSKPGQLRLVTRQAGSLEVERGDLPFQLARAPVATNALDFVGGAFEWVLDRQQLEEVAERQPGDQLCCGDPELWRR